MKTGFRILALAFLVLGIARAAWAVYPPEPQSGGTFVYGKGTKTAADYRSSSRTGRPVEDTYFGRKLLKVGSLQFKPMIGYDGQYDSNVYLEDDDTDHDYISRMPWGVDAELPFSYKGEHSLFGAFSGETEWFANESSQNHTDFYYQGGGSFNFPAFKFDVYDEFKNTVDRTGNELTQRVERNENFVTGLLSIPFGGFFVESQVSDYNLSFEENAFEPLDRNEFSIFPRLGVNVGKRTQVLGEYGYTNINYDDSSKEGDSNQASLGVRGFVGEGDLVSYQLWGGYEWRGYDNSAREDYDGFITRGQAIYRPDDLTQVILDASRKPVEAINFTESYYVRNEVGIKFRRQIAEKLWASIRALGQWNQYNTDRDDWYWDPGVGLEYLLPGDILSLFTEYRYTGRESDRNNTDYMRHLATIGVRAEV